MVSSKAQAIKPFYVMDVLEKAQEMQRAGIDVIPMYIGEPDFETPEPILEAMQNAMRQGQTNYTHSLGIPELREAICIHHEKRYGVQVDPGQVVVANGTSPAMLLLFMALLEPGDEVVVSDPHYACYPTFIRLAGGEPVFVPVREDDGFQYRAQAIQKALTPKTKGIFINSPANPTGTLLSAERMQRIVDLGLPVISDEIYHGLVYDTAEQGRERSILEFSSASFALNGFSKCYAMTGLRLGYCIAPKEYMNALQKLSQNLFISANSVTQWGGVAALQHCDEHLEHMRLIYDERRRYLLRRLQEIGFGIKVPPTGAFYILANARFLTEPLELDSYSLAFDILENAAVGVTPGTDFGPGGEGYIRFSYATSLENIEKGMERLQGYVRQKLG